MKKVIIFDLDGTLVDSVPDLALAVNDMLKTLGRETFEEKIIRTWVGNGAQTLVKRSLCGKTEINDLLDPELFNKALEIFLKSYAQNLCVNTVLYPDVFEVLQNLETRGFRLALVTNKPFDFIEPLLIGLGIDNMFELCLGGDSLLKKKPDPMPLIHVCETLGIEIDECLMIGDSKNDILAAKSAGMQSIGVTYGYNYNESISLDEPEAVIESMSEVCALLGDKD
ncbi:phosphoglycolate phosphatase [Sulfurimonas sp. MAG313]|nr:phosphoglycolate phosphatase [Sulfurimonas sp. MAG313]